MKEQEERFLNDLWDYAYAAHSKGGSPRGKSVLDSLNALIDLRINPPIEPAVVTLKSLEEHNTIRRRIYDTSDARMYQPRPNGIACPKCGTELIDSNPTMTLASNPPQKNTKCPSCDYVGYRVA